MEEIITRQRFLEEGKKSIFREGLSRYFLTSALQDPGFNPWALFMAILRGKRLCLKLLSLNRRRRCFAITRNVMITTQKKMQKSSLTVSEANPRMYWMKMLDYMYEYYDEFKLLFCRATGTKYENYLEEFITVEVISTGQFLDVMKKNGILYVEIDEQLSHNLASMLFNGMIEVFKHDMTYEHARDYVTKLRVFYTAGWMKLFERVIANFYTYWLVLY